MGEPGETLKPEQLPSQAKGQYRGPGITNILRETEKFEGQRRTPIAPEVPVQPTQVESSPPPPPPTAEQALRSQLREPLPTQPQSEPLLKRLFGWLSPERPTQAASSQGQPKERGSRAPEARPMTEEQKKWAELSASRRGTLASSAPAYRIRETKQMGPLRSRG